VAKIITETRLVAFKDEQEAGEYTHKMCIKGWKLEQSDNYHGDIIHLYEKFRHSRKKRGAI
jgi:hypothetical protein